MGSASSTCYIIVTKRLIEPTKRLIGALVVSPTTSGLNRRGFATLGSDGYIVSSACQAELNPQPGLQCWDVSIDRI